MSEFSLHVDSVDPQTDAIRLEGEVDVYTAPQLKHTLEEAAEDGKERVIVDLLKATFIDSTTLGVLVAGTKKLHSQGGSLAVICTDSDMCKLFRITGLEKLFPVEATEQEALTSLNNR